VGKNAKRAFAILAMQVVIKCGPPLTAEVRAV